MTVEPALQPRTLNVFELRQALVRDYSAYMRSFLQIHDPRIRDLVNEALEQGLLWPEPLIQMNPAFEPGAWVDELVDRDWLHPECRRIFRKNKTADAPEGSPLLLHRHQVEAIEAARAQDHYILTTGTGSGKSLAYIVPIVDHVLRRGRGQGIQAIVLYPMNALANSQYQELQKFLCLGYPPGQEPVRFAIYTGQERDPRRQEILADPPDILLTNYVMMELILTRPYERPLIQAAQGLKFLVLDELHTYRGRQGADVAMLVRRLRDRCGAPDLLCVGTSATLAGEKEGEDPRQAVAGYASRLFGVPVKARRIIGETLRQMTTARPDAATLRRRLENPPRYGEGQIPFEQFVADPLSAWIERTFGVTEDPSAGGLKRALPRALGGPQGAARQLAAETGLAEEICRQALEEQLLRAYRCQAHPETGNLPFAFRLHQFFSRGDTVYATLEEPAARHLTLTPQRFVPRDRSRLFFPLVFCRECGQEYYCVRRLSGQDREAFEGRNPWDRLADEAGEAGFLYLAPDCPWPDDLQAQLERVPEDWLEETASSRRLKRDRRPQMPRRVQVAADGTVDGEGLEAVWFPAPFPFCLRCGVAYHARLHSDIGKLTTLDTGGRSTATTVLSLSALRAIHRDGGLLPEARKLLSFTDNRQDASLQAGHFNDFIEVGLVRSALYKAALRAGPLGLHHEDLAQRVFEALDLPLPLYALDPKVKYHHVLEETRRALREVLAYRIYRDQKAGWRVTAPNLEQCGLLVIEYPSLDELCRDDVEWSGLHPVLASASPETRQKLCRTLLDYMRHELALKVDHLTPPYQDRLRALSSQHLIAPWAIDDDEVLETSTILYPRSRRRGERGVHLSARGGFGQYVRRLFRGSPLRLEDVEAIGRDLLQALKVAGLVVQVDDAPGYQIPASALRWVAGQGKVAFYDPIRIPRPPRGGSRTNPFFVELYRQIAGETHGFTAREHTAQVPYELRQEREQKFATGELPVLYCSPTMELGVDIRQLNVVNMRNVPPTPANYAQRSGRAGRSGQPALVFTYCTSGSPHDQYFFKRPERMVAGAVTLPRIDLTNEDLLRSHVYAVWLAETGASLGSSLKDILELEGDPPPLTLRQDLKAQLSSVEARKRAHKRLEKILTSLGSELAQAPWYHPEWLEGVLASALPHLESACSRWKDLYRAARRQMEEQHRILLDASRSARDKEQARRLYQEANAQRELLEDSTNSLYSDFYSYRYFASEGFLPGYNFPRLPVSAFIPGRRSKGQDEFLSRARFVAITEFGPRSIVYHEGSKYRINKVLLPAGDSLLTRQAKLCPSCGYLHPVTEGEGPDLCERCRAPLGAPLRALLPMHNVATRRQERIHSDEEERLRLGYQTVTAVRFPSRDGRPSCRTAVLRRGSQALAGLAFSQAATLWRINLGWTRRRNRNQYGFLLDVERGFWQRHDQDQSDPEDPLSKRLERVIPYVEDHRNCLLLTPSDRLKPGVLSSLLWALKQAIQLHYQLEESELAAELLPSEHPTTLLFYEASEGGAGVLQRLLEDPSALAAVARKALENCHFDPSTGQDLGAESCEAACYDCLLNYGNQRDHAVLDRKAVRGILWDWAQGQVEASPTAASRAEHLAHLLARAGSELERQWLHFLDQGGYRLPDSAQVLLPECGTRPDFLYTHGGYQAAIYIDGPPHLYPGRAQRDLQQQECMEDLGYTVIRFRDPNMERVAEAGKEGDWSDIVRRYPALFGAASATPRLASLDLFEAEWHPLLEALADFEFEPGGDLAGEGSVVGAYLAEVRRNGRRVRLVDARDPAREAIVGACLREGALPLEVTPDEPPEALRRRLEEACR